MPPTSPGVSIGSTLQSRYAVATHPNKQGPEETQSP